MIIDITDTNVARAKAFLERAPETALFLLSNLRAFGTRLGESLYSGNFKAIEEHGDLRAVFCLTRGGTLVAQGDGRTDRAREIVRVCREESIPIRGVLGEWELSRAIWDLVGVELALKSTVASKEVLYRLPLNEATLPEAPSGLNMMTMTIRTLNPGDQDPWEQLSTDFLQAVGLPVQGNREQRKAAFVRSAGMGHWWGAFDQARLVSLAGIIAFYESIAQIGGVFTRPEFRRRGLSRAVMAVVIRDSLMTHRLERLFLFTTETNVAARCMYESLAFEQFGHFGLFFGEPTP